MSGAQEPGPAGQDQQNNRGDDVWADSQLRIVDDSRDDRPGDSCETAEALEEAEDDALLAGVGEFREKGGEGWLPETSAGCVEGAAD